MNTFGNVTAPALFLTIEAQKLHREFEVAASTDIYAGQQVKLNATGQIVPAVAADTDMVIIGTSMHTRLAADTSQPFPYGGHGGPGMSATIIMRGYITVQVEAGAAVVCGPVKFSGLGTAVTTSNGLTHKNPQYVAAVPGTDAFNWGWAVTAGTAQASIIEVVLR